MISHNQNVNFQSMRHLYSVLIRLFGILLPFISIFNKKIKKWYNVRQNWDSELKNNILPQQKYIWFHCASAGEFEQARPLIRAIKIKEKSNYQIAVSFFSTSGFDLYVDSSEIDLLFYLPLDTLKNAQRLIDILQPTYVFFIRYEIWWNTLHQLKQNNIPTFLLNANAYQKRTFIYDWYLKQTYPLFTKIFHTQDIGNTKVEQALWNKNEATKKEEFVEVFCKDNYVLIAGSSWQKEEALLATFYKKNKQHLSDLKIIIAPHELDEKKHAELEQIFDTKILLYTDLQNNKNIASDILFINQKGILKYIYRYAAIAFIGGGFSGKLHNTLEAAVYEIPILFGPKYEAFEEANELIKIKSATAIHDYSILESTLLNHYKNKRQCSEKSMLAAYFSNQYQTAERILNAIQLK